MNPLRLSQDSGSAYNRAARCAHAEPVSLVPGRCEDNMEATPPGPPPLQFETATPQTPVAGAARTAGVTCAGCQRTLDLEYFDVNGASVCAACRDQIASHGQTPQGWGVLARAAGAGLVAAILGAILYYAVMALAHLEIGIIAIAIGYMVGYAIRMATGGRGGRRFQVLAIVLTYWSVGLAYTPFLLMARQPTQQGVTAPKTDLSTTVSPSVQEVAAPADNPGAADPPGLGTFVVVLAFVTFTLPVLSVVGTLPGGLLSAAIIGFGMQQAWRMTATPALQISGPYRIGPG